MTTFIESRDTTAKEDAAVCSLEGLSPELRNKIADYAILTEKPILLNRLPESQKAAVCIHTDLPYHRLRAFPSLLQASPLFRKEQLLNFFARNKFTLVIVEYHRYYDNEAEHEIHASLRDLEKAAGSEGMAVLTEVTFRFLGVKSFDLRISSGTFVRHFMKVSATGLKSDAIFIDSGPGSEVWRKHSKFFRAVLKGLIDLAYALNAAGTPTDWATIDRIIEAWFAKGEGRAILDRTHYRVLKRYRLTSKLPLEWADAEMCAGC